MPRVRNVSAVLAVLLLLQSLLAAAVSAGKYEPELRQSDRVSTGKDMYPAIVLDDFNDEESVQAWKAGQNTDSVHYVTSLLNGPNQPFEGAGALEQVPEQVKVYEWRSIYRDYEQPLDLSGYRYLALAANSWGWQATADYALKVALLSGDDRYESVAMIRPDSWRPIFIDLSDWAGRSQVTKLEISFMQNFDLEGIAPGAPGYDYWDGRFQIDYITATNARDLSFDIEGDTEGFTAAGGSLQAAGGQLVYTLGGTAGTLESPALTIDAAQRNGLSVTMTNGTGAEQLTVQWRTAGTDWDDMRAKTFDIPAAGTFTRDFNFSDREDWSGTVTAFRLSVPSSSGTLSIDQIAPKSMPVLEKPFDGTAQARIEQGGLIAIEGTVKPEFVAARPGARLYLFELATYEDPLTALPSHTPLADTELAESFRFETGLNDGTRSRLYSKFAVAARSDEGEYTLLSAPQYVANAESLSANLEPFPEAESIKGLQVQMTGDAQELGISHAALNVPYNELMYKTGNHPNHSIPFEVEGKTYFFRKDRIEQMDRQIKSLSDNGIIVSLILIMYDTKDPESANEYLLHPDAEPGGTVYALNTSNAIGVEYVKAATKFLAERYSRPDQQFGRAVNYIVGNEVGQNKVWNNMGPKRLEEYVREYAQTLRLVDTIVKTSYANARTYISLDHFWNENLGADSMWKYDNKAIVDRLTQLTRAEGDFGWHVAFHPYPENLFNPRFWNDATATDSFDTERITFKNLDVLVDYMKQPDYTYGGEMRRIILSEQGFHSLTNSEEDQKVQAAAYAYAYYIIKFLDGIDAFILHRHVDHGEEGGLNLGLWTHTPTSIVTPDRHKAIYDVFKYIDTERSLEVTNFAKAIIGILSWEQAIPGFDPARLADRSLPLASGLEFAASADQAGPEGGFEAGTDGFAASDEVSAIRSEQGDAFRGGGYLAATVNSDYRLNWAGVQKKFEQPIDAKKTPYFTAALQLPDADPNHAYYAKFIVYSGSERVEGTARLDLSKGWNDLALPLKGWKGIRSVDGVKIWVRSVGGAPWQGEIRIDEAKFVKKFKEEKKFPNVEVEAKLVSPALETGAEFSVTVTNFGSDKLNKKLILQTTPGLKLSRKDIHPGGIRTGESRTFSLHVSEYMPTDGIEPELTIKLEDRTFVFPLKGKSPVTPEDGILYDFEDGAQGWGAGENVASVAAVQSFPNGPGVPSEGRQALSARSAIAAASAWKTVKTTPERPFDLSGASVFSYDINSYGGVPGATYETRVTLRSGPDSFSYTSAMSADRWNRVSADLSAWTGRSSVTDIEISFRAVGSDMAWNPEFQLDRIGVE
ncbi:DUF5722 domain-containing protein [Cohnella hongkongensis]|uniref:DUF5722 domain-containing protein n=1 Tax=Cohnella hongkongensis TaxID=178337 RepID=A0ABV9FA59_9BACL